MTDKLEEPVDVVFTWVDGSDPELRREMRRYLERRSDASPEVEPASSQFEDNDELKFSLRSLEKQAPWVGRVHLVTNGQVPSWLRTDHPRLRVVHHSEIFRDRNDLPTFNSNAIELQLHRIHGLSRRFLYFNDDLFLGQPVYPEDFILTRASQIFYFDRIHLHRDTQTGATHDRAYAFTRYKVMSDFPWGGRQPLPAHCPQLYDREILRSLEQTYRDAFIRGSAHRFRHPEDVVLRVLYSTALFKNGKAGAGHRARLLRPGSQAYEFLMLPPERSLLRALGGLLRRPPRFFCINNDFSAPERRGMTFPLVRLTLRSLFPRPSSFER